MRSLRARLFVLLITATVLVWSAAAVWTYISTKADVQRVLDRRLVEAAGMVASLVQRNGGAVQRQPSRSLPVSGSAPGAYERQLSCQVWTLDWDLVAQSRGAPEAPLAQGEPGFSERTIGREQWRVYTMVEPKLGFRILVGDNLQVRRNLVGDVLTGLLLPAVVGLLALGLLIWSALDRGLRPLRRAATELRRRDPSDTRSLTIEAPDEELRSFLRAINGLFSRLDQLRGNERHFIASAAHELQTPLAGLRAHAQVAVAATDRTVREQSLRSIQLSVDRTSRLVQQLLDLSREEADAEPSRTQWVLLGRTLNLLRDELHEVLGAAMITLSIDPHAAATEVLIDEAALMLALRNLIKNAIDHSPPRGKVDVTVDLQAEQSTISVVDQGPGIPQTELPGIRDRFVRGSRARGAGSGLGLSIVELVLGRSGAALGLQNISGGGFKASMRFSSELVRRQPVK